MQKVRNCLEHRAGVVRKQDLDEDGAALTLSFPRLKVFYMRGDKEIELARDERVDARDGQPTVQVLCRTVTRSRAFQLGERVMLALELWPEVGDGMTW
jgi:hypothetical protein